ncbi:hypothetical protein [Sphingomonas sp. KC8]|uniref:hypothetical protein n=1 Tax=Sphingomonas sp. KC8 TaxID=1030157 RepID=UPI0011105706|nr:hypothetical protein [Sphingomonas sp. KC8]
MTIEGPAFSASRQAPSPFGTAIINLDRKISNAIQHRRGIRLTPEDLDLLTLSGAIALLGDARNQVQKENAEWRSKAVSTPEANITSITSRAKAASLPVRNCTSVGMTATQVGSNARALARQMFS